MMQPHADLLFKGSPTALCAAAAEGDHLGPSTLVAGVQLGVAEEALARTTTPDDVPGINLAPQFFRESQLVLHRRIRGAGHAARRPAVGLALAPSQSTLSRSGVRDNECCTPAGS